MNVEKEQWNLADQEFGQWLKGHKIETGMELTDILKSAHLVFRAKQRKWIKSFCQQSLDYLKEQENKSVCHSLSEPDNVVRFRLSASSDEDQLSESKPLFSKRFRFFDGDKFEKWTRKNNERIIQGILSGDADIFNELYKKESPKVDHLVALNAMNPAEAQDIFQDGIVVLLGKVYQKELDLSCSVSTYLYAICRNLLREQLRRHQRTIPLYDPYESLEADLFFNVEEPLPEVMEIVNQAIETLGDPCKQLLESFYYQNMSYVEIAFLLGYATPASARNQKYKCLERIRHRVSLETV